ncbi:MAG: hypothetical protein ACR2IE_07575 [Candidatus Sumerlaeaceae bacterium]
MRSLVRQLQDNAMFYKDITQWLRNRTFIALFFGLLLLAEGVSVFIMSLGEEITRPGPKVFYSLYVILVIYALIIAFMGHSLTAREFANRTFELYELSGMSLERMIGGKLLSMVYEFLFGFFCIVPFMFFAYFLGGLDFFELISGAVLTLLAFLPLYLLTLLVALSTRLKQVSTLGRVAAIFAIIFIVISGFISLVSPSSPLGELFRATSNLIKDILTLNVRAIVMLIVFMFFYAQLCLLIFYLCCNTISRESDSRELPIKLLFFTLVSSWLCYRTVTVWRWGYSPSEPAFTTVPVFLALCVLGLTLFYNRPSVPVIIKNKYQNVHSWRKLLYICFQPGTAGTMRTIVLVLFTLAGTAALIYYCTITYSTTSLAPGTSGNPPNDWLQAVSMPMQIPFFLVFPFGLLLHLRGLRTNYALQRTLVAMWWGISGAVFAFFVAWWNMPGHTSKLARVFEVAALLVSPFSSAFADLRSGSGLYQKAPYIRFGLGLVGLVLMYYYVARMRALEAAGLLPRRVTMDSDSTSASLAD